MLLRSIKYTEGLADAKAERNDALRDDVAAGRRQLHQSSLSVSAVEIPPPSGVNITQPPPDWQTPLNGIISPSRADHYAKTTGRNPKVY